MTSFVDTQQQEEDDVFCTFALTKSSLVYQGIYVCSTCSSKKKKSNECCCAGCADVCHAGHDVRLLAYGNSYCDCGAKGPTKCSIIQRSIVTAEQLMPSLQQQQQQQKECGEPAAILPVIPLLTLHNLDLMSRQDFLVEQCVTLVRQSKETFWLGNYDTPCCDFEQLAKSIAEYHWQRLGVNTASGGVEWWIQVKADADDGKQAASIGLHYDKDETIAELFTLGFFPLLSTVSYLTQSHEGAAPQIPTLILDTTASSPVETTPIRSVFVSYPRVGKHVAFRGDLLHGAPKQWMGWEEAEVAQKEKSEEKGEDPFKGRVRVTFLVNLWTHRPAAVERLPEPLVALLAPSSTTDGWTLSPGSEPELVEVTLEEALDSSESSGKFVNIPFIEGQTQGQAGGGDEEEDEDGEQGLYCLVFVPRRTQVDSSSSGTFAVQYEEDEIAATLQYEEDAGGEEEEEEEEEGL